MAGGQMAGLTRRGILAGLAFAAAGRAAAESLLVSPRPVRRPAKGNADAEALIEAAGLGGEVSFVLADLQTGAILQARGAERAMPPASTAKTITTLYALAHLPRDHRFRTRLMAAGPRSGATLAGDLILVGGGDPTLVTDDLGDMAAALAATGIRKVTGQFGVWGGALPYLPEIDTGQPEWLGYNPAISGLNLNFNRVNFTWKEMQSDYQVGFDAQGERFVPPVDVARIRVVDRDLPVYTYGQDADAEVWTVARGALNKLGSRWLPVRRPEIYAGNVLQNLARADGVQLPGPRVLDQLPEGETLLTHESEALPELLRGMLKYSTNLTAEVVGMTASKTLGISSHGASVAGMMAWLAGKIGARAAHFVDHSGLGGASRISAQDMVQALVKLGPAPGLGGLLKEVRLTDPKLLAGEPAPQRVVAKTGTLNFVSGLVGYLTDAAGRECAFAIYAADVARRDAVAPGDREKAPGASGWAKRARRLQLQLLASWA